MDQYSEDENQGKKKLLIPLLILLLCAVSMIGAGYAVTNILNVNDNDVDSGYIYVNYDGAGPIFNSADGKVIIFSNSSTWEYVDDGSGPVYKESVVSVKAHAFGDNADEEDNSVLLGSAPIVYKQSGVELKSVKVSIIVHGDQEDVDVVKNIIVGFTVDGEDVSINGDAVSLDISTLSFDEQGVSTTSYDVVACINKEVLDSSDIDVLTSALSNVSFSVSFVASSD
ncbi:hypothetical protein [Methanomethylophilus alvi]|uniref:hypothetical protein n=1 Tax=Methanomethylophilus alvi TaxID=1291540 RepID=UPI0037DD257F